MDVINERQNTSSLIYGEFNGYLFTAAPVDSFRRIYNVRQKREGGVQLYLAFQAEYLIFPFEEKRWETFLILSLFLSLFRKSSSRIFFYDKKILYFLLLLWTGMERATRVVSFIWNVTFVTFFNSKQWVIFRIYAAWSSHKKNINFLKWKLLHNFYLKLNNF